VPWLAGGFVGVDVFFVISGFLITRQLLREAGASGRVDVAAFYARRIRRLLPAFTVMLAVVLLALRLLYSPLEQPDLFSSALAASLYFSNIHYAGEATRYLGDSSSNDPLLHTWSLAVEEQFYLAWPWLLLAAGLLARRFPRGAVVAATVAAVSAASLALNLWLTPTRQPDAFFLPFTRAWEFGLGALVALAPTARLAALPGRLRAWLPPLSLALVLLPVVLLSGASLFPGANAIPPVLGTALLILLLPAAGPRHPVHRGFASAPLQWLGRHSYSWYLWHWPVLVIGRLLIPSPGVGANLLLVMLALLPAALSLRLVEQPLRTGPLLRPKAVAFALASLLGLGGAGVALVAGNAAIETASGDRFAHLLRARSDLPPLYLKGCEPGFYDAALVECASGPASAPRTAVLIGDSHAGQWISALELALPAPEWRVVMMTKSSCPLLDLDIFTPRIGRVFHECRQWRDQALARIRELRPDLVVASSYEHYDFSAAEWRAGTRGVMLPLAEAGARLVILRDTPAPGFSPPLCLSRREWSRVPLPACTFDPAHTPSPGALTALREVAAARADIDFVDLTPAICPGSPCTLAQDGTLKFRDEHHLSDRFVRVLAPTLRAALLARDASGRP
jgi:peptidoglycan/LPS O-acetylase OafA/YrhL